MPGLTLWLAITLGEHGEWLTVQDRTDEAEPLFAEARAIFERLKARPWLERLQSWDEFPAADAGSRTADVP